jgi:pimeloyl-ACP methyl ester carboxylesterase
MPERITEVAHDGLVLDVLDEGPVDGEVVVLLHGFPERAAGWSEVARRLHAAGYRTVAPDQRGYSPRARPGRRRDHTLQHLAADAGAVIDAVGGPVHLVGHDWGAAVAWLVAGSHPGVRSLTSFSVSHPAAYLKAVIGPQGLKSWYVLAFQLPGLPELLATRLPRLFAAQLRAFGMTDAEVATVMREVVESGALPGGLAWYRALPFSIGASRGLWDQKVAVPVTHAWSTGDVAVSRRTAETAHRWTTGPFELVVIEGASHWLPEQHPDRVAEIVLGQVRAAGYSDPPTSRPSAS